MNLFNEEKVIEMECTIGNIKCSQLKIDNNEYFFARDDRFIARASDAEIDKNSDYNGLFFNKNKKTLEYWITLSSGERKQVFTIEKHNVENWSDYCDLIREYSEILDGYSNYGIYDLVYDITEGKSITGGKAPIKEITSSQNMNYRMYFYKDTGRIIARAGNGIQVIQDISFFDVEDFVAFAKKSGKYCVEHNLDFMEDYVKTKLINGQYIEFVITNEEMLAKVKGIEETLVKKVGGKNQTSFSDLLRECAEIYTRKESGSNDNYYEYQKYGTHEQADKLIKLLEQLEKSRQRQLVRKQLTRPMQAYKTDYEYYSYEYQKYGSLSQFTTSTLFDQLKQSLEIYLKEESGYNDEVKMELHNRISKLTQICLSRIKRESRNSTEVKQSPLKNALETIMTKMGIQPDIENQPISSGVVFADGTNDTLIEEIMKRNLSVLQALAKEDFEQKPGNLINHQ